MLTHIQAFHIALLVSFDQPGYEPATRVSSHHVASFLVGSTPATRAGKFILAIPTPAFEQVSLPQFNQQRRTFPDRHYALFPDIA